MRIPSRLSLRHASAPSILVSLLALVAMATDGRAETIYTPTSWALLVDTDVSTAVKQATRFHTTATGFVLSGVSLQMRQDAEDPATGSLNWLVYPDNSGEPGPAPVSGGLIFNQDVSTLGSSYTTVSTGTLNLSLSPSTDYWLVLNGESLSSGVLQIQNAFTASGTGSPFFAVASYPIVSSTWTAQAGNATVGTMTAVPEPLVGGLTAADAGLVALMARCRRASTNRKTLSG